MPKVNFSRVEIGPMLRRWELIRDCISGQDVVKENQRRYLPKPNAHDCSPENDARYLSYLERAVFYNVTDNTLRGLVGQVFSTDPVVELPDAMMVMENDIDGAGVTLTQQVKKALSNVLAFGRCGLLTDFPEANADGTAFSAAQIQSGDAKPTVQMYDPEQIINWRTRMVRGNRVLSLVVISTDYIAKDDGFELKTDREWRVLSLDAQDLYQMEVWRKRERAENASPDDEDFYMVTSVLPTDYNGNRLDYIPFQFVGSLNNNEMPDKPPMYDMAVLNMAHYRNSADFEESVYMVGSPTPFFTGLTDQWVKETMGGVVQLGSRAAIPLPKGSTAGLLVAAETTMAAAAMEEKERKMVSLGAQLVEQKTVQRTLGEAKMEKAVVNSTLVQCAKNVATAYQNALQWACDFYGSSPEEVDYQLSTDFAIVGMTPEDRTAWLADLSAGIVSWTEVRYAYRQAGLAYLDDEKARAEIDKDMAEAVDLDKDTEELDGNGNPLPKDQ